MTAIALIAAAGPAIANEFSYTSSAPSPTREAPEGGRIRDVSPVLLRSEEGSTIYGSNGFISNLADDQNLYVERIYIANFTQDGKAVSLGTYSQIDCGRGLVRTLGGRLKIDGELTEIDLTPWRGFQTTSVFATTCERAASDRGIVWRWNTEE